MTIIQSTNELSGGWYRIYQVDTEADALEITGAGTAYLYQSRVIHSLYLFIPVEVTS